eukprot:SAG11_NODE_18259_length_496_cov_0.523929_1_plen_42_part_01
MHGRSSRAREPALTAGETKEHGAADGAEEEGVAAERALKDQH